MQYQGIGTGNKDGLVFKRTAAGITVGLSAGLLLGGPLCAGCIHVMQCNVM